MDKKNSTVVKAQEIFQLLPPEKQKKIKSTDPEVYNSLFGDNPDSKILDNFIRIYQEEFNISDRAQMVFSRLTLGKQIQVKTDDPKMYNALFDQKNKDNATLQEFLDKYETLNEKIITFDQFQQLSLEDQLRFKQSFPQEYRKIIATEPQKY